MKLLIALLITLLLVTSASAQLRIANDQGALLVLSAEDGTKIDSPYTGGNLPKTHEQSPYFGADVSVVTDGIVLVFVQTGTSTGSGDLMVKAWTEGRAIGPVTIPIEVTNPGNSGGQVTFTGGGLVATLLYFLDKP